MGTLPLTFKQVSKNILMGTMSVPFVAGSTWDRKIEWIDGEVFEFFRNGCFAGASAQNGESSKPARTFVFIRQSCFKEGGVHLPPEETPILNVNDVEGGAKHKNEFARGLIAQSLKAAFNNRSLHITEVGCGVYPIASCFGKVPVSYHGIECDKFAIETLRQKGISASQWDDAPRVLPERKPAIMVGVFSLHHMVDAQLPKRICDFTRPGEGFYVGNYHTHGGDIEKHEGRAKMKEILNKSGMAYIILTDPKEPSNEYYIIGRPESYKCMTNFSTKLQERKVMMNARSFEVHASNAGTPGIQPA